MSERDNQRAVEQAAAQYASILSMVQALQAARDDGDDEAIDEARRAITEDALEVSVGYSGWYGPGEKPEPDQYRILLCTGGPAVQIFGKLGEHNEPISAELQWQDWFQPWSFYFGPEVQEDILLEYAREFNFEAY
jgi:hypothetical protein